MLDVMNIGDFMKSISMHKSWITNQSKDNENNRIKLIEKKIVSLNIDSENLTGAVMSRCRFIDCTFENCNLTTVNFVHSTFENCAILSSQLIKTEFNSAICVGINLENSNISRAAFYKTILIYSNLSNCDLSGAELIKTDLRYANFENVNLDYARSSEAKIYNTSKFKPYSVRDLSIKNAFLDFSGTENQKSDGDAISYLFDI